nr:acyltransferase [Muribaculaceae bacterium]
VNKQISSITQGPRQSNFELLRILAMFLILILHANGHALGLPDAESIHQRPFYEIFRIFCECFAIIGVNVFVLISGWFGIRASKKGFLALWFQVIYFYLGIVLVLYCLGLIPLSLNNISSVLCLNGSGWFVVSYSILYILSPVLNKFLETAPEKTIRNVLLAFFAFEIIYGMAIMKEFSQGSSGLSFMGLYLLAGYLRKYGVRRLTKWAGIVLVVTTIINAGIFTTLTLFSIPAKRLCIAYCSPLVIIPSVAMILWFSRITIKPNRFINFIAASAFAVYLFHDFYLMRELFYCPLIRYSDSVGGLFGVIVAMVLVYTVSVILDQPRKLIWNYLKKFIS